MTQAPQCHSDASSTGSSASVRFFARLQTSPCVLSDRISIHESNLRRVQTFSNRARRRQPELTFAYIVFYDPNHFSSATECWLSFRRALFRALESFAINPITSIASQARYSRSLANDRLISSTIFEK
ncbi:unnamed protein product [Lasius platythorax]|uniref:Uncharacterized protein n=1 Tax=Lasius platythorax TaxID=488582 RepID=A0AAV2NLZ4_9HYME